ncbi:tumor protein D54-like isoform X5 [Carassius auratus]|uniref:Tumor protein D54-like isoform X5 n=1 Tax=Carassius auratus TaxID=7957 RepID=A0A6P6N8V6_CARAU|nr:tumor protein D54-like isoform X5 [Carassius auratus]XP_052460354.1 tumor protein D54 isoform X6 [Carassius gibelio]
MDSSEHGPAMSSTGVASGWNPPPGLTEEEAEEMQVELIKVEDEIETLRQVLVAKERHAAELKRRLGIGPLSEIKQNLTKGWHEVQCSNAYLTASSTLEEIGRSDAYKRTQETLSQAGQMTSAAFSSMGSAIRNQFGEMRNSPSFKTFEDKVENMKYKVMGQTNEESDRSPTSNNAP